MRGWAVAHPFFMSAYTPAGGTAGATVVGVHTAAGTVSSVYINYPFQSAFNIPITTVSTY
jgi:hypothetical protein